MNELLLPDEVAAVDRAAIARGPFDGFSLMRHAGAAVAQTVLRRFPQASGAAVLCGPGNNGGDGYVAAEILRQAGLPVRIFAEGEPQAGSAAALAAGACGIARRPLPAFVPQPGEVVVDALYGAGLARPVSDEVAQAIDRTAAAGVPVVAVDLPSGVSGASGKALGAAFRAAVTVTFVRRKPGHLLQPGRSLCGEVVLADIGIGDAVVAEIGATCFENTPHLWGEVVPSLAVDTYKYARGHAAVVSAPVTATGAARLAALAALRAGAGAVTLLSPADALIVNAAHLTAVMLRRADTTQQILDFVAGRRCTALALGPGLEPDATTRKRTVELAGNLAASVGLVLDAGALTALKENPAPLFDALRRAETPFAVMTPHEGEFARVFPDLAADGSLSKLERARRAAARAHAVVVYKGPDTVIAAPCGRAAINANGTPLLATAGSGDVLTGIVAGFLAQKMPAFEAACAAVYLHAEAARRFGPGLIAEDLPRMLAAALRELPPAGS